MHEHATMHRCFRLVWSAARGAMVAVSDASGSRGKTSRRAAMALAAMAAGVVLALGGGRVRAQVPAPNALPTGATVVAGSATLQQTGAQLTVQQASDRLITNWQTFDIGSGATVRFNQPGAGSVALNRVLSNDPSAIYGALRANGQVFLVNPSGVLFGASARVDVGGLVASSLQLTDADFLAARYRFGGTATSGTVGNEGRISAAQGGYLAFIAPRVNNSGSLRAPQGTVALGAGEQASLDFAGDKLLRFTVDRGTVDALVDNQGLIQAAGGSVLLSARAADVVTRAVVNQGGVVEASSLVAKGGRIVLEGDAITLAAGSRTEATGATGGGTVLVGGDWQGGGDMRQARSVTMDAGASIGASATRLGDGGRIVLWSDVKDTNSSTRAAGTLRARAGAEGGNGGQIETSGHAVETDGIRVDAGAAKGNGGLWLIDPADSVITQTVANGYQATLNTGTSVLNDVAGSITWNNGVTLNKTAGGDATLTLRTGGNGDDRNVRLDGATIGSTSGALNLVFWTRYNSPGYSGQVSLTNSSISTNGGHLWAGGGNATSWNGLSVGNDLASTWNADVAGITLRNSSISSGAGHIHLGGMSYATGSNNGVRNFGLLIDSGSSIASTSGSIDLSGALLGRYATGSGVWIGTPSSAPVAGNVTITSGSGAININGTGADQAGSGSGWRVGLMLYSGSPGNQVTLRSSSGAIGLTGAGTFGAGGDFTSDTSGLQFQSDTTSGRIQVVSASGDITLSGQSAQQSSQYETAIRFTSANAADNIRVGTDGTTPYSGNILIEGDSILQRAQNGGAGSLAVQTSGNLTIAPRTASFTALRAGNSGILTFDDDWNFGTTLGGFTLGKAGNSSNVSIGGALSTAGPIEIHGGGIALNANLTTTASGAGILVKASGDITSNAGRTLRTNNGDLVLWSNSANSGNGSIQLGDGNALDTANGATGQSTGGGRITLGGGLDTSTGFAASTSGDGIMLGTSSGNTTTLRSGGGDILLRGKSTAVSGTAYGIDLLGGFQIDSGQGAITMRGESSVSYGIEIGRGGVTSGTLVSAKTTGNAIDLGGITTNAASHGLVFDYTTLKEVLATGGGNIAIAGTGNGNGSYGVWLQGTRLLANTGGIAIDGGTRGITVRDGSALGSLAGHASVPNASGNITLTGDVLTFNTSGSSSLKTTGALTLQPHGTSFASAFDWGGNLSGADFVGNHSLTGLTINQMASLGGLTVGKAGNTAAFTSSSATSIAGPITVYGGDIAVTNLTTTAAGADILLKGSGNISTGVTTVLQTNAGAITLWSDSDASGDGFIVLNESSKLDSRSAADRTANRTTTASGGGAITLGGGNGSTAAAGFATSNGTTASRSGVNFGDQNYNGGAHTNLTTLFSGGGDIVVRGRTNTGMMGLDWVNGGEINAGTGTVNLVGQNTATGHGIELASSVTTGTATVIAGGGSAAVDAITITGSTAAASPYTGVQSGRTTLQATGAGGITLTGTATGTGTGKGIYGTIDALAGSGAIVLNGGVAGMDVNGTLGTKVGTLVTASSSDITLTGNSVAFQGTSRVDTSGKLTVQPFSASFSSALTLPLSNPTLGAGLGGLSLGKPGNTADITLGSATSVAGPISVYGGAINVNGNLTATAAGDILLRGSGTVTIAAGRTASTSNGDVTVTGSRFLNNSVASALSAGGTGKAWRVWSSNANPFGGGTPDVSGGLVFDFKQYDATYGTSSVLGAGNGLFYGLAPTLTATLGGTATTKAYDGTLTAALTAANYSIGGAVNGDLGVVLSNPTSGSYASRNVGTGIAVTATGATVLSATSSVATGSKPVYGYAVGGGSTTGNIGTITPKALTATATAPDKVYDGSTTAAPTLALAGLVGSETLGVSATGSFNSKDVSTANTVTVNSTVLADGANGGLAGNYSLAAGQTAAAAITAKALTATVTAPAKTYDGTTAAAPTLAITAGLIGSETVGASGTASFNTKDVLTATTVTVTSTTLADGTNGGLASNYSLAAGQTAAAAITAKALTATVTTADKVYDGSTAATATLAINSGLVGGETLGVTGTGTFDSKDVLAASTVTVNSTVLADGSNGGLASNYSLAAGQTAAAAIVAKPVTATVTAADKVYDGSTSATATLAISAGLVGSETLGVSGTGAFNSKDVLAANTVTVNSTVLANGSNGGLASNYSLAAGQTTAASITPKVLTATATAPDKVYDGSTTAAPVLGIAAGLIGSETVTATGTGSFDSKDVLTATTVTVASTALADGSNGGLASNYLLGAGQTAAARITPALLTATATAPGKVYDGNTIAAPMLAITAGLVGSETLGVTGTGSFDSKDVLTATTVTVSSTSLASGSNGGLASNYTLGTGQTAAASITPRALTATATAPDKVYDGTTAAAATLAITAGLVGSESLGVTGIGSFDSKDVLAATTVTVGSVSLANGSNGGLAANYALGTGQTAAARITPRPVAVAGSTGLAKTYDGTSALPAGSQGSGSVLGLVAGDAVSLTGAPVFDSVNAGARTVLQGTVVLAGDARSNYSLGWTNGSGVIDPAPLTVRAIDDARFVTQADAAGFNGVGFSGLVNGESPAVVTGTLAITRSNAGTNGAGVYAGVLVPSGLGAANYSVTFAAGDYTIVPAGQLLVRTANTSVVYGNATAYRVASAQYLDGGNVIQTLAAPSVVGNTYTYDDGAGGIATFTLAPRNPVTSGAGSLAVGNYGTTAGSISESSANFSNDLVVVGNVAVTPRSTTVAPGGVSKVYDGTTAMTGLTLNLSGLLAGDAVTGSGQGQFASRNVGTGLGYAVTGLALGGADAGNYILGAGAALSGADGSITPKSLVVSGLTAADKVYDGNAAASVSTAGAVLSGLIVGDEVNVGARGQFGDKNAAAGKTVTVISSYSGADVGNYRIASQGTATAGIARLGQVTWTGGSSGNWFDPANWAGGAVPDLANVSRVVIPAGVTVTFGDTVVPPAERGAVQIDRLGSSGSLDMAAGTLNVGAGGVVLARLAQSGGAMTSAGDMRLGTFVQSGGSTLVQGALTVTAGFEQGRDGGITVRGSTDITDTRGGILLGNLSSGGPMTVRSLDGDIRQAAGTTLVAQGTASFLARTASGQPADVALTEATNAFAGRVDISARNTPQNGASVAAVVAAANAATQALTQAAASRRGAAGSAGSPGGVSDAMEQIRAARPVSVSIGGLSDPGERQGRVLFALADAAGRDVEYEAEVVGTTLRIKARVPNAAVAVGSGMRERVIEAALQALESQLGLSRSRIAVADLAP